MVKRQIIVLIVFFSIIIALWFVNNIMTVDLYFQGIKLTSIQEKTNALKRENIILQDELLQKSAYTTIRDEANKRGLIPIQYVTPTPR